jgi:hypothetical protein
VNVYDSIIFQTLIFCFHLFHVYARQRFYVYKFRFILKIESSASTPYCILDRDESITFRKTLSNLFVPKHYYLPFHSRFVRFTVSFLFFIFRTFPRSQSLVRGLQFPFYIFASRQKIISLRKSFNSCVFLVFFSIISFLLFQSFLVALKKY